MIIPRYEDMPRNQRIRPAVSYLSSKVIQYEAFATNPHLFPGNG